jgi:hypothetical protein
LYTPGLLFTATTSSALSMSESCHGSFSACQLLLTSADHCKLTSFGFVPRHFDGVSLLKGFYRSLVRGLFLLECLLVLFPGFDSGFFDIILGVEALDGVNVIPLCYRASKRACTSVLHLSNTMCDHSLTCNLQTLRSCLEDQYITSTLDG